MSLPPEAPPTYDYSYEQQHLLEQRVRLELHHVGLLRDDELEVGIRFQLLLSIARFGSFSLFFPFPSILSTVDLVCCR
jgi:hypothetical protein